MVINNILDYIFNTPSSVKVLRVLINDVVGLTGRQIANLANINHQSAHDALNNLESLKLIKRVVGGKSHIFTLNRKNHLVNELIIPIFNSEINYREEVFNLIKNAFKNLETTVILFGSVARKEETSSSDLDICIIYSNQKIKLSKVTEKLSNTLNEKYGITLSPFYISYKEFRNRARYKKPPVDEIIKEGIILTGKPLKELI